MFAGLWRHVWWCRRRATLCDQLGFKKSRGKAHGMRLATPKALPREGALVALTPYRSRFEPGPFHQRGNPPAKQSVDVAAGDQHQGVTNGWYGQDVGRGGAFGVERLDGQRPPSEYWPAIRGPK